MKKMLLSLKKNGEMFYLGNKKFEFVNNKFNVGFLHHLKPFVGLERREYISVLSHRNLVRLLKTAAELHNESEEIIEGSPEYKRAIVEMNEANRIIELLDSEENKELEHRINLRKMKKIPDELSRVEILEFCKHLGMKTFNTDIIIHVHPNAEAFVRAEYGSEDLFKNMSTDMPIKDQFKLFDFDGWANLVIENSDCYQTSKGQIIQYNNEWLNIYCQ